MLLENTHYEYRSCSRDILCAPSMGVFLWVKVPSQVGHDERSEAQLHEGDRVWEGSTEHKFLVRGQKSDTRRCQAGRAGIDLQSSYDQSEAA